MHRSVHRAVVAVMAIGSVAVACGGDDDASAPHDGQASDATTMSRAAADDLAGASDHDLWVGELEDGSELTVRLRAGADDPAVAPFDAFREQVGGPDVVWIVADVSVPAEVADGTGSGRFLTFAVGDADVLADDPADAGDGVTSSRFACSALQDWLGATPDDDAIAAYIELYAGACANNTLAVAAPSGATTTYVMVHDAPLPDFNRVLAGLAYELQPG